MSALVNPEFPLSTNINGVHIVESYAENSDRSPLVLANGIGTSNSNWGSLPTELNNLGVPCLLVDVAKAKPADTRMSLPGFSDVLVDALDELGYQKVDLLGLSWGGALAQETAIRHPNRIGNLVLAATLHGWDSVPPRLTALRALLSTDRSSSDFKDKLGDIYGGDIRQNPELVEESGIIRDIDPKSYNRQAWAILRWNHSLARAMQIKQSTLIMSGADDPIVRLLNARRLNAVVPNSRLHVVGKDEGGGHIFLHTRPRESAIVIEEFLSQAPARSTNPVLAMADLCLKSAKVFASAANF